MQTVRTCSLYGKKRILVAMIGGSSFCSTTVYVFVFPARSCWQNRKLVARFRRKLNLSSVKSVLRSECRDLSVAIKESFWHGFGKYYCWVILASYILYANSIAYPTLPLHPSRFPCQSFKWIAQIRYKISYLLISTWALDKNGNN